MEITIRPFFMLIASFALVACEPTVAERGNTVDPDKLAQLHQGMSKDEVAKLIGSPTTVSPFDENYWYYMGQRTEQEAFFDAQVTNRRIVEVDFDDDDKVATIKQYGKDQGESVDMVSDTTQPQGHQTTLAEELFGRGGFGSDKNKKQKKDTGQ